MVSSITGHIMVNEYVQLGVATFAGPLFVGIFMFYLKHKVDDFFTTLDDNFQRIGTLDRVVQGTSNRLGLLDVVESHDEELERAESVRRHNLTRLRLVEKRIDKLARRAEARTSLAEESEYHRRQAEQIAEEQMDRANMDDIEGTPASTDD